MNNEAILMNTHNVQCYDYIRIFSLNICFLDLSQEIHTDSKPSLTISHGKRAIEVRATEVRP